MSAPEAPRTSKQQYEYCGRTGLEVSKMVGFHNPGGGVLGPRPVSCTEPVRRQDKLKVKLDVTVEEKPTTVSNARARLEAPPYI